MLEGRSNAILFPPHIFLVNIKTICRIALICFSPFAHEIGNALKSSIFNCLLNAVYERDSSVVLSRRFLLWGSSMNGFWQWEPRGGRIRKLLNKQCQLLKKKFLGIIEMSCYLGSKFMAIHQPDSKQNTWKIMWRIPWQRNIMQIRWSNLMLILACGGGEITWNLPGGFWEDLLATQVGSWWKRLQRGVWWMALLF